MGVGRLASGQFSKAPDRWVCECGPHARYDSMGQCRNCKRPDPAKIARAGRKQP